MRLIILLLLSGTAWGQSSSLNLNLPSTPGSYASDRIRTNDGVECSMAIGGSTNVEFGVVGLLNQNGPLYNVQGEYPQDYDQEGLVKDIGVYAKITIPLNAPKTRLDCNRLYLLELARARIQLEQLRREILSLQNLQFEGDN